MGHTFDEATVHTWEGYASSSFNYLDANNKERGRGFALDSLPIQSRNSIFHQMTFTSQQNGHIFSSFYILVQHNSAQLVTMTIRHPPTLFFFFIFSPSNSFAITLYTHTHRRPSTTMDLPPNNKGQNIYNIFQFFQRRNDDWGGRTALSLSLSLSISNLFLYIYK